MTRSLTLLADNREEGHGCRMRFRARSVPGLLPMPCLLEIWNLPEDDFKRIQIAKRIAVCCDRDVLAAGRPVKVVQEIGNAVVSVIFSPVLPLWEARVSLSMPAGIRASDTVRALLAASGTGIGLLSWTGEDPIFARGQAFRGRAAEAIASVMEAAGARGVMMPAGLALYREGKASGGTINLKKEDLLASPGMIRTDSVRTDSVRTDSVRTDSVGTNSSGRIGGVIRILKITPRALTPGMTMTWPTASGREQGMLQEWLLDADTAEGPWGVACLVRSI